MKKLVIGIIAHVDSGKTTLSEALLYSSGEILKLGRVDHKNSFLDNNLLERERGITIFSKQARFKSGETEVTLLDTPGHVDFSAETERTFCVLDYAILVISGTDGVQSHTETLWKLLSHYNIPTFIFVNKTDLDGFDKERVLSDIKARLSAACVDFTDFDDAFFEDTSLNSEEMMEEYLSSGQISDGALARAVGSRELFPCYFGSALKGDGVEEFIEAIDKYTIMRPYPESFGAKIYKIADDEKGKRIAFTKITGGSLAVKSSVSIKGNNQKINELRLYSGSKYTPVNEVYPGDVCAICGLTGVLPGTGLGIEKSESCFLTEPVFTYCVKLPDGYDVTEALRIFRRLEEEDTQMRVIYSEHLQKIDVQIMGEIQLEILKRVLSDRFELDVEFEHGSIIYKESVSGAYEGVGHYEPLRHYAEVHLRIEPANRGDGIIISAECPENTLDKSFQNLVLTHLREKVHVGVLTGSPLTDIKITLINGRSHLKHTEGGDFRQATYRALRQGLMQARAAGECVLLEPWYTFTLELPTAHVGRALTDLDRMKASFELGNSEGEVSVIVGEAPVSAIREYSKCVISYTHGKGRFSCSFKEYAPSPEADSVIDSIGYDPEGDLINTPDSVFCSHGGGFLVKWDQVFDYMHLPLESDAKYEEPEVKAVKRDYHKMIDDEAEILRMFEMTYGKIKRRAPDALHTPREHLSLDKVKVKPKPVGPTYLLIDGYNIIYAWDDLKGAAAESLDLARNLLINRICNYQAMTNSNVILVFDAYKVKGGQREIEKVHGITVVYTKEAETADQYIEKTSTELSRNYRVRVATSDAQVQMIIFGSGAVRIPALEFEKEVCEAERQIKEFIENSGE